MECRKVMITFRRKLNPDEETQLIAYFKGFILRMKEALMEKKKFLNPLGKMAAKFGNPQIRLIQNAIDALLMSDASGVCQFDKHFDLDKDDANPMVYSFTYPNTRAVFGMGGRYGINLDALDKLTFKDLMNQAGIDKEIETIEIHLVNREV